jgi:hypothetical protein
VDPVGQLEDLGRVGLDRVGDQLLGVGVGIGRSRGWQCRRYRGTPLACRRLPDREPQCQARSVESIASATETTAMMNSAMGIWNRFWSRRTTSTETMSMTQAPRRTARIQSPR